MLDGYLTPLFLRLQQEAFLVGSCLATGMTEIRAAHVGARGKFYTAFFQLAIGLERLCKLILILRHLAGNQLAAPRKDIVKGYGHDISTLIAEVGTDAVPASGSIASDIFEFLNAFAKSTRYSNLDALANGISGYNVLAAWDKILQRIARDCVSESKRKAIEAKSDAAASLLQDASIVLASDLSGKPMTLSGWFSIPDLHNEAAKHVVWAIVSALQPLLNALYEASYAAESTSRTVDPERMNIPVMTEFFGFLWANRAYVMRKRKWP